VIDAETDGCPCYCCGGDDNNQVVNDEDGVTPVDLALWSVGVGGGAVDVRVTAIGSTAIATGYVNAWIDWDQNGQFDAGEQILVDAPVPVGTTQTLTFDIPYVGQPLMDYYYARFRLYDAAQGTLPMADGSLLSAAAPTGLALNGEVEDYRWQFEPLAVTLTSFDAQPHSQGILVTWETVSEIENAGFNLYRTDPDAALPQPVDLLAFVPSQAPGSLQGFAYSYEDLAATAGQTYAYWLEDISWGGATTVHGPVIVTVLAPTAVGVGAFAATSQAPILPGWLLVVAASVSALAGFAAWQRRASVR
jgi:hypothetical protein